MHHGQPSSGVKLGVFSKDYSLNVVKSQSKKLGSTVNDVMLAVISLTLKEYMIMKGDEKTSQIQIA